MFFCLQYEFPEETMDDLLARSTSVLAAAEQQMATVSASYGLEAVDSTGECQLFNIIFTGVRFHKKFVFSRSSANCY